MLRLKNLTSYLAYPSGIVLSFIIYIVLEGIGFSILVSTYTPVIIAALVMCGLEFFIPHRDNWNAKSEDVKNDLLYMGLVQILLPKFLSFFFAITLISYLESTNLLFLQIWPSHLPIYIQAILMLLGADFFRY